MTAENTAWERTHMRLGITLPILDRSGRPLDARGLEGRARAAEDAGLAGVWVEDVLEPGAWRPDPTEWLLPAAAVTERIELGVLGFQLAGREPVESAHEFISLQALSGLRLTVGVSGGTAASHAMLGSAFDERFTRLHEHADTVRRLAAGEVVGEASLETWPTVRGTLRMALHAENEGSIARGAREYDAWITSADDAAPVELGARLAAYRAARGSRAIVTVRTELGDAASHLADLAGLGFDDVILCASEWESSDRDALNALVAAAA